MESVSKALQGKIGLLKHKKYREKYKLFVVEGHKSFIQILKSKKYSLNNVFLLNKSFNTTADFGCKDNIHFTSYEILKKMSSLSQPNDLIALFDLPEKKEYFPPIHSHAILLDNIQDPGNLGSIIRTAAWFGINPLLLFGNCADIFNPKVIQASMGTLGEVDFYFVTPKSIQEHSHKHKLIGLETGFSPLNKKDIFQKKLFVLGNEGNGISISLKKHLTASRTICGNKKIDSLNVASTASILFYEISKNTPIFQNDER